MTNVLDFNALIDRAVKVCLEAVTDSEGANYPTPNEATPFFFGRVGNLTLDKDGDEIDTYTLDLTIFHISGNRTEGIPGEADEKLYDEMNLVLEALLSRDLLQSIELASTSEDEDTAIDWLEGAYLSACSGWGVFDGKGIGLVADQIGTTYTLTCIYRVENFLDYE